MTSTIVPVDTPQGQVGSLLILLNTKDRSWCLVTARVAALPPLILSCWLGAFRNEASP
jgi:hypothetical protein